MSQNEEVKCNEGGGHTMKLHEALLNGASEWQLATEMWNVELNHVS